MSITTCYGAQTAPAHAARSYSCMSPPRRSPHFPVSVWKPVQFNRATRGQTLPPYLSSDHDPLYRFHQWQANLRILDVREIKTVPYAPLSHPFVERLIGAIRRECLDRMLFWTAADLELKLLDFQRYYNGHRTHAGLDGRTPESSRDAAPARASLSSYRWQPHCRGQYQTPIAA